MGAWFVTQALNPWTGPLREVQRLQSEGPRFYKADKNSSKLYDLTKQAFYAIKRGQPDQAWQLIQAGRKLDQRSPVFDYLEASVQWTKGDREAALRAIDTGNAGSMLRAYATYEVSPDRWQWPEIDQIKNVGTEILDDPHSSRAELTSVLRLGHKIVWSAPPDFRRLLQGAELRRHAAQRLLPIAKEEGNTRLAKLCEELIRESVQLKISAKRRLAEDDQFLDGSRAWVVGRALDKHDPEFRYAAMLLVKEKQAEWGREFRDQHMQIKNLKGL